MRILIKNRVSLSHGATVVQKYSKRRNYLSFTGYRASFYGYELPFLHGALHAANRAMIGK